MRGLIVLLLFAAGCQTFTLSSGKKYRQFAPTKDRIAPNEFDTSRFVRLPFNISDYTAQRATQNNKRIIVPLHGADIKALAATKEKYCIYFWNATCSGTTTAIHKMDSLSKTGRHILIVSLRRDYDAIDATLNKTNFARYPYYTVEDEKYSDVLIVRQARFIKEACNECYEKYKDDLIAASYLILENGSVRVSFSDAGL